MKKTLLDRFFGACLPSYDKYREVWLYLFFGALTSIVGITSYIIPVTVFHLEPLISNIISWILAVSFAYVTNRIWVFESKEEGLKAITKEAAQFCAGRLVTLGVEEVILLVGIRVLHINKILIKVIAQVIIVILNYIISKLFVFKGDTTDG